MLILFCCRILIEDKASSLDGFKENDILNRTFLYLKLYNYFCFTIESMLQCLKTRAGSSIYSEDSSACLLTKVEIWC